MGMVRRLLHRVVSPAARIRVARAIERSPRLNFLLKTLRHASLVENALAFSWNEITASKKVGAYQVHGNWGEVVLRHGTSDVDILQEIMGDFLYEPPPPLALALGKRQKPLKILDLGGHVGVFGLWALHRFAEARVRSIEPDPDNWRILAQCRARSPVPETRWTLEKSCVGEHHGLVSFSSGRGAASHVAEDGTGNVDVVMIDVFDFIGDYDIVKMDIEGGEWPILSDPRLLGCPPFAIALECHPKGPGDEDYLGRAVELLAKAGYVVSPIIPCPLGVGMFWAWRGTPTGAP